MSAYEEKIDLQSNEYDMLKSLFEQHLKDYDTTTNNKLIIEEELRLIKNN